MQISLPPGTSSLPPVGSITFSLAPIFLNSSLPAVSYCLKLWGAQDLIPLTLSPSPLSMNSKQKLNSNIAPSLALLESLKPPKLQNPTQNSLYYALTLPVTVNLSKLTNYFIDMNVIVIVLRDARSNKEVGIGYVRVKRYVVNGVISQFQERVQIVNCNGVQRNGKRVVIGEVGFKFELNVPVNMPIVPSNQNNNNTNLLIPTYPNKPLNQPPPISQSSQIRRLIVQPHIFQSSQGNQKQFIIDRKYNNKNNFNNNNNNHNNNFAGTHNVIKRTFSQQQQIEQQQIHPEDDRIDTKNILQMMSKSKSNNKFNSKNHVLDFLQGDSIKDYPDLDQLISKYGRNNVCAQRMRLKLDQAKYLNKSNPSTTNPQSSSSGYILKLLNIPSTIQSLQSTDYTITVHPSQKSNQIISQINVKSLNNAGLYLKNVQNNYVLEIQNKLYKGKFIVRNQNIEGGQIGKIYVKRKDNNKKIGQFDIVIQNIGNTYDINVPQRENSPHKHQNIAHPHLYSHPQSSSSTKLHYYISVKPLSPFMQQPHITLHPQCQKQPVQGKKMIFTAENTVQNVKISIQNQNITQNYTENQQGNSKNQQVNISINPSIKMKQQNVKIGRNMYRVFVAVGNDVQGLMKIVVTHDGNIAKNPNQQPSINPQTHPSSVHNGLPQNLTRSQKLSLLLTSFHNLLLSTNPACTPIIHKLSNPTSLITYQQQISLFQQLCVISQVPYPLQTTHLAFKQLLHGEFSMYWSCFIGYKTWNNKYQHALAVISRNVKKCLEQLLSGANGGEGWKNKKEINKKIIKIHQKIIQKLYKNKQCLFSLVPINICLSQIQTIINNAIKQPDRPLLTQQKQHLKSQGDQLQQNISSNLQHNKTQQSLSSYLTLLTLLCRYQNININNSSNPTKENKINSNSNRHCIKIQQLSQILTSITSSGNNINVQNNNIIQGLWLNQHQLEAIANFKEDKDNQLLFEVVESCCAHNSTTNKNNRQQGYLCSRLCQQLNKFDKIQSMQSSISQHDRMYTQNNTNKMYTQQPQRIHTQDIHQIIPKHHNHTQQSNPNPKTVPSIPSSPSPSPSPSPIMNMIKIYLTALNLTTNLNNIVATNSPIKTIIEIYETKINKQNNNQNIKRQKVCIWKSTQKQLPKAVKLKEMEDYDIIVKVYDDQHQYKQIQKQGQGNQEDEQICRYQGVFIASSKLDKIILYHISQNSRKDIGYISTTFDRNNIEKQEDQLIIYIKNQTKFPQNYLPKQQQQSKRHSQQLQYQLLQITKPSQHKLLTCPIISYKILSITPALRSNQQFSIMIQNAQYNSIIFPSFHAYGKIFNKDPQQQYLNISITNNNNSNNGNSSAQFENVFVQKIRKCQGVQQLCFMENTGQKQTQSKGKVRWVMTVQLAEYFGEDMVDNNNISDVGIRRWMVLNLYHLQSIRKLSQQYKQLTVVITTDSNTQPIFIKDIPIININHQPSTSASLNTSAPSLQLCRTVPLIISSKLPVSTVYPITVYSKPSLVATKQRYMQQNILCHFQFKPKYHINQIGIFQNKGYIKDIICGYRMAINLIQVCYNDVFSKQQKGREVFEKLLTVFQCENIIKIGKQNYHNNNNQTLQRVIRGYFGFNNTQIHLLFQLQNREGQLLDLFVNWDIADAILTTSSNINQGMIQNQPSSLPVSSFQHPQNTASNIANPNSIASNYLNINLNLNNYSIADLCSEYQLYDFTNSGLIPKSKFQMINKLIFGHNFVAGVIPTECFDLKSKKQGWVKDLAQIGEENVDYVCVLWCIRKYAKVDNYFSNVDHNSSSQQHYIPHKKPTINPNPNPSLIPPSNTLSHSITLLGYRNLTVDNQPATLTFYINGDRIGQPILRCYTHEYKLPLTVNITKYPIVLQIYNKKYGVKELYNQELVASVKVMVGDQRVQVLGGEVYFMFQDNDELDRKRGGKNGIEEQKRTNNNDNQNSNNNTNTNMNNTFRQSRRQKWQNLKQSREDTQKITDILSRLTA